MSWCERMGCGGRWLFRGLALPVHPQWLFCFPYVHAELPSRAPLFATPWAVAHQAPLSMGFSRQEYWGGLPYPPWGDLPSPAITPASPVLADRFFTAEPFPYVRITQNQMCAQNKAWEIVSGYNNSLVALRLRYSCRELSLLVVLR